MHATSTTMDVDRSSTVPVAGMFWVLGRPLDAADEFWALCRPLSYDFECWALGRPLWSSAWVLCRPTWRTSPSRFHDYDTVQLSSTTTRSWCIPW